MKMIKQPAFTTGFTLIELLVVIAIIGIISTVAYVNFGQARAQARDDIRQSQIQQLQIAIELYKAENGEYPEMGCGVTTGWVGPGTHSPSFANPVDCPEYIVGLVPDYIPELPIDPTFEYESDQGYLYQTFNDRQDYKVLLHNAVEVKVVQSHTHPLARCPEPALTGSFCQASNLQSGTYAVYSYEARFR